ncbi:hypothetical protein GCM10010873_30870 [Cypionkella aquatica]|uniref:DUF4419 domain-containing protein n=1 Tax=Cypionkella aquatica TaxID=1756042 RepID=A0AA37X0K7_9RHOB|nr:hypothetical protein [Cypionkella aquatica]GLS88113.1 hypothetical protein GCM10010873_30870 [Cypionkella aquatica]
MRILPTLLCTAALAASLHAEIAKAESLSTEIGTRGLAATEARLAALETPTDADRFALAGTRFLGAVEAALQLRYAAGMTDRTGMLPFLRLPLPDNPTPAAFQPAMIADLFRQVDAKMQQARAPLAEIPQTSDFTLEVNFADLWFDINANQSRDAGEDALSTLGPMLLGWQWDSRDPATPAPVVKFDAADAAWLSAYTHLLQGLSQIVLAYDPTEPITRIREARAKIESLGGSAPSFFSGGSDGMDEVDVIAIVIAALQQTPDAPRMAAAHQHLLAMIADNRRFWAAVTLETDNAAEWLPNDKQQSALGVTLPPGTGATWMAVLQDAEALLNGTKLAPYWRQEGGAGINIAKVFNEPRPADLAGWIQGWAAAPYLEQGTLVSGQNWSAFEQMVGGEAMMLSFYLN